ncbi:hypothetical protein [Glutamicibacter arilaitensis]|uniref:hypothetical protein n=1 Tax=Glutamicibacter arilaitensis TaxID=256701 RepID=UPI003F8E0FF8
MATIAQPSDKRIATYDSYSLYNSGEIKKDVGTGRECQSIAGMTIDLANGSALQERVTLTRIVATGIFALALKKKKGGEQWLLLAGEKYDWLEDVPRKKQEDAQKFVQAVLKKQRELKRSS